MILLAHSSLLPPSLHVLGYFTHVCCSAYKMSSGKQLIRSLGVLLVVVQILVPLSGHPIIGEHSEDKESYTDSESRETPPFTAFTAQMSPSTDRPVVSEPETSSHKPSKSAATNKKNEHRTPAHLVMDFDHWDDRTPTTSKSNIKN